MLDAILAPKSAHRADVSVLCVGIGVERIGESPKTQDFISLVIIKVKAVFLFKTNAAALAVGGTDHENGMQTEIVVAAL